LMLQFRGSAITSSAGLLALLAGRDPHNIRVLARANSDPAAILRVLGEPRRAGVTPLYKSETLTMLNVRVGQKNDDHAPRSLDVGRDRGLHRPGRQPSWAALCVGSS
jgi:hypothetical protein